MMADGLTPTETHADETADDGKAPKQQVDASLIDAALAELKRSGDPARAAVVGGLAEPLEPPPQPEFMLEQPPGVAVPGWLSTAPLLIGAFSITLFVLNTYGVFGEGPDLDALADGWSKS